MTQNVPFILAPNTVALWHRKSASAGSSGDSCGAQVGSERDTLYAGRYNPYTGNSDHRMLAVSDAVCSLRHWTRQHQRYLLFSLHHQVVISIPTQKLFKTLNLVYRCAVKHRISFVDKSKLFLQFQVSVILVTTPFSLTGD